MSVIVNTYGALLLGSLVATFLSGINTLQTIVYFRLFPKDPNILKAVVSFVWSLDIIHTAFVWVAIWTYFIVNIGHISKIDEIQTPELIPGMVVVTVVVTFIVHMQVFFCMYSLLALALLTRRFKGSIYNVSSVSVIKITGLVYQLWLTTSVDMYRAKKYSVFIANGSEWILSLGLSSGAAADVAIMVAMFVLLKSNRQRSISLNNVIDQLILYTVEMGSVTAITAVVCMITWFARPHTLIFGAFYLCVSKLYAISLTGMLITRYHLRQRNESENSQGWKMSQFARVMKSSGQSSSTPTTEVPLQEVHVDVTRNIQYDDKASSKF